MQTEFLRVRSIEHGLGRAVRYYVNTTAMVSRRIVWVK